jgi:competence ComEA-like helix-hairpin-helix protein
MSLTIKMQSFFGVSKSELTIVGILMLGLFAGLIIKAFTGDVDIDKRNLTTIYKSLDSLAEVQKTTYIGTDIKNNAYPELVKGDTIVKKPLAVVKSQAITGKIDLNTASKLELMRIPGIGEKTAIKIIEYRSGNKFKNVSEIMNIKGIGDKKFGKMKDFIEVK